MTLDNWKYNAERKLGVLYQKSSYFMDIDKLILKFIWRGKRLRIAKTIFQEKHSAGELTVSNFNTYYYASVISVALTKE